MVNVLSRTPMLLAFRKSIDKIYTFIIKGKAKSGSP
jgi:hypothetical protein